MVRLLLRVAVVAGAVIAGHKLGGVVGMVLGACLGTVLVTQTEDVLRIAGRSADLGGSVVQMIWRFACVFLGHTFVRRFLRTLATCLFVSRGDCAR